MRAIVTGSSGFLGSHIADALSDRGDHVTLVDMVPSPWRRAEQEECVIDLRRPEGLQHLLAQTDTVFHCAAQADLATAERAPVETAEINVLSAVKLFSMATEAGVSRFVLASSMYALGSRGGFYGASKASAEMLLEQMARGVRTSLTVLRFGSLYGPRADGSNAIRRIIESIDGLDGEFEFWGNGTEIREYIHVRDAASLSLRTLELEGGGGCFHIVGRERISTRELLELLGEMLGEGFTVRFADRPYTGRYRITPYTVARRRGRHLASESYVDLASGLAECIEEHRAQRHGIGHPGNGEEWV